MHKRPFEMHHDLAAAGGGGDELPQHKDKHAANDKCFVVVLMDLPAELHVRIFKFLVYGRRYMHTNAAPLALACKYFYTLYMQHCVTKWRVCYYGSEPISDWKRNAALLRSLDEQQHMLPRLHALAVDLSSPDCADLGVLMADKDGLEPPAETERLLTPQLSMTSAGREFYKAANAHRVRIYNAMIHELYTAPAMAHRLSELRLRGDEAHLSLPSSQPAVAHLTRLEVAGVLLYGGQERLGAMLAAHAPTLRTLVLRDIEVTNKESFGTAESQVPATADGSASIELLIERVDRAWSRLCMRNAYVNLQSLCLEATAASCRSMRAITSVMHNAHCSMPQLTSLCITVKTIYDNHSITTAFARALGSMTTLRTLYISECDAWYHHRGPDSLCVIPKDMLCDPVNGNGLRQLTRLECLGTSCSDKSYYKQRLQVPESVLEEMPYLQRVIGATGVTEPLYEVHSARAGFLVDQYNNNDEGIDCAGGDDSDETLDMAMHTRTRYSHVHARLCEPWRHATLTVRNAYNATVLEQLLTGDSEHRVPPHLLQLVAERYVGVDKRVNFDVNSRGYTGHVYDGLDDEQRAEHPLLPWTLLLQCAVQADKPTALLLARKLMSGVYGDALRDRTALRLHRPVCGPCGCALEKDNSEQHVVEHDTLQHCILYALISYLDPCATVEQQQHTGVLAYVLAFRAWNCLLVTHGLAPLHLRTFEHYTHEQLTELMQVA